MNEEEKRALEAFRALREGGRKGGASGVGESKRREPEHYKAASLAAAKARARNKGLELFEVTTRDGSQSFNVGAADGVEAKSKVAEKHKIPAKDLRSKLIR